jgi:hypothetical protein
MFQGGSGRCGVAHSAGTALFQRISGIRAGAIDSPATSRENPAFFGALSIDFLGSPGLRALLPCMHRRRVSCSRIGFGLPELWSVLIGWMYISGSNGVSRTPESTRLNRWDDWAIPSTSGCAARTKSMLTSTHCCRRRVISACAAHTSPLVGAPEIERKGPSFAVFWDKKPLRLHTT